MRNTLQALGLNENEITVYLALLKEGLSPAGPLIKATQLHRMIVYNALEALKEKDLLRVSQQKRAKAFQARDPKVLLEKAEALLADTKNLLPKLESLRGDHEGIVDVKTLMGHDGFVVNLEEMTHSAAKQKDKTMRIIGGAKGSDFYTAIGAWYPSYQKLLKKLNIKKQLLAPASFSSDFKKKFVSEPNSELKTMPKGLTSPTYTRITNEMVSIEIYKPKIVIIQIRNEAISKAYMESFKLLW